MRTTRKRRQVDGSQVAIVGLRAGLAIFALIALVFDAAVSNAAGSVDYALELLSQPAPSALTRAKVAADTGQYLESQWSRPMAWHGGAVEARAWAAALEADGTPPSPRQVRLLEKSAHLSWAAVQLSPVTPTAWTRLQILHQSGVAGAACGVSSCVDRSYLAAPLTMRPALECARFTRSPNPGPATYDNLRLVALSQSDIGGSELANCLRPLGADYVYRALRLRR